MNTLWIATGNAGKLKEFRRILGTAFDVQSFDNPPEVLEDGNNYHENALKKARAFSEISTPVLADDSGLEVDCLDGKPGLYSARFGGENLKWPERWECLWQACRETGPGPWKARFRAVLCFLEEGSEPQYFEATTDGEIINEPRGDQGFGYDPVFRSLEIGITLAEASFAQKDQVSHRAGACRKFRDWFATR